MDSTPVTSAIVCLPVRSFSYDFAAEDDPPHIVAEQVLIWSALSKFTKDLLPLPKCQILSNTEEQVLVQLRSTNLDPLLSSLAEKNIHPLDLVEGTIGPVPAIDVIARDYTRILNIFAPGSFCVQLNEPAEGKSYSSLIYYCPPGQLTQLLKIPELVSGRPLIVRKNVMQSDGSISNIELAPDNVDLKINAPPKSTCATSASNVNVSEQKASTSSKNAASTPPKPKQGSK
jgi:hypothetical protein